MLKEVTLFLIRPKKKKKWKLLSFLLLFLDKYKLLYS